MPTTWYIDPSSNTATYTFTTASTTDGADLIWQVWANSSNTTSATATGFLAPTAQGLGGLLSNVTPFNDPPAWWREQEAQDEQARRLRRFQEEDLARRQAVEAERDADPLKLRRTKVERARDAAKAKALGLLCDNLIKAQITSLVRDNHFLVQGSHSGKLYRIDFGYARNVRRIDITGKAVASYCAHPANGYEMPDCDSMLMQKLMLEISEHEFLKIANPHPGNAEALRAA